MPQVQVLAEVLAVFDQQLPGGAVQGFLPRAGSGQPLHHLDVLPGAVPLCDLARGRTAGAGLKRGGISGGYAQPRNAHL